MNAPTPFRPVEVVISTCKTREPWDASLRQFGVERLLEVQLSARRNAVEVLPFQEVSQAIKVWEQCPP